MPGEIRFHPTANDELYEAHRYAARSPLVATRFLERINRAILRLATHAPTNFPIAAGDYRYVRIRGFPYVLIFKRRDPPREISTVYAVAHTSRRDGYWLDR